MKRKYFKRYFISCSIVLALLFGVLIFWGYFSIQSNLRHTEQLDYINQFEKTQNSIENSLNISVALGQLLTESDTVIAYAQGPSDYESMDFFTIKDISETLSTTQTNFSNLNLNIALLRESSSMVIIGEGTRDRTDFYHTFGVHADEIFDLFAENTNAGYYYQFLSRPSANNTVYLACQRIYAGGDKSYLCISFSQPDLSYLPNFSGQKSLLISGEYSDAALEHIAVKAASIAPNIIYRDALKEEDSDLIYSALKNMPNIIFVSEFSHPSHLTLFLLFLLTLLLGLGLAVVCAYLICRLIYKPIQNLITLLSGDTEEFAEDDEFAFLVSSTWQIMETNRTLTLELDKQQSLLRDKFIFDLLNGFIWGDTIYQSIDTYGMDFLKHPCTVILFEETQFGLRNHYLTQELKPSESSAVFSIIKKQLLGNTTGVGITTGNQHLFILPAPAVRKQAIFAAINAVREETEIRLKAAVSNVIRNIEEYKYVYSGLIHTLEQRYMLGDMDILIMDNNNEKAANEGNYSIEEEQRLTEYLLSNESEKALLFLNQILARTFRANLSGTELSNFRIVMLNSIRRLLFSIGKTPEELFPEKDILKRLETCEDNEEFRNAVVALFKTVAHTIQQNIIQRQDEITTQILEYIQQNLDKDLSMDDICNKFGMSASTVARRLKEKGISFKSYLNDRRIHKAKELMQNQPELMIKDIARMTGFNNIVSFNRLFKKYETVSPGQYMENLKLK